MRIRGAIGVGALLLFIPAAFLICLLSSSLAAEVAALCSIPLAYQGTELIFAAERRHLDAVVAARSRETLEDGGLTELRMAEAINELSESQAGKTAPGSRPTKRCT